MYYSPIFKSIYFPNFRRSIQELSKMAAPEIWDYKWTPTGYLPILVNYVHHTFAKLESENKVEFHNEFSVFNTGLVTINQEEIFGFCQKNKKQSTARPNYFIGWRKVSDRQLLRFSKLPEPANYFQNPADLIYNLKIDLRPNIEHKTAIPQYYKGKLQLLLPLCLITKANADLALVVDKENCVYRASTCLTLDMAINNARLIARPDDEWLKP